MTRTRVLAFAALSPGMLFAAPLRNFLEASMALHMLVELPLLFAAGWAAGRTADRVLRPARHGLAATVLAACVAAWWMVPAALDLALVDPAHAAAKYAGCYAAGFFLGRAWPALGAEIRLFTLGNLGWMAATAGMLYAEAPSQLCVSYLRDEQRATGAGLFAWGVAALGLAALQACNPRRR